MSRPIAPIAQAAGLAIGSERESTETASAGGKQAPTARRSRAPLSDQDISSVSVMGPNPRLFGGGGGGGCCRRYRISSWPLAAVEAELSATAATGSTQPRIPTRSAALSGVCP